MNIPHKNNTINYTTHILSYALTYRDTYTQGMALAWLLVLTAGNLLDGTVDRRHPQVGGPSVKNNLKLLSRWSNGDLAIVLGLHSTHSDNNKKAAGVALKGNTWACRAHIQQAVSICWREVRFLNTQFIHDIMCQGWHMLHHSIIINTYIFVVCERFWRGVRSVLVLQVHHGGPVHLQDVIVSYFCKRYPVNQRLNCVMKIKQALAIHSTHPVFQRWAADGAPLPSTLHYSIVRSALASFALP